MRKEFLDIKIIPNASKNEIVEKDGHKLKVRIKAVPEKGKANKELIKFLSSTFNVSKSQIEIVRGNTSRQKRISITYLT